MNAFIVRFLRYGNGNKQETGIPAGGGCEKQRQSVDGDPGGYLSNPCPRDPERSADVNEYDKHRLRACLSGGEFLE